MAYFKALVRCMRQDGFGQVYIRVIHHRQAGFIKTEKVVTQRDLSRKGEITDPYVLKFCSDTIIHYQQLLNSKHISNWSVAEVIRYLTTESDDISFSDYAREHIKRMINRGQDRNARNYSMALSNLEMFLNSNKVMFSDLTSNMVNRWLKSLEDTKRAKEMYPICLRQVFKVAMNEFNDYDNGNIRIKTNPWVRINIPKADQVEKKAISPEACRIFFAAPIPDNIYESTTLEIGRDVAKMVLCLAGINTVDLYNLRKEDYHDGKICYKRAKTKKSRRDGAYIEMRVEPIIRQLVEKYLSDQDDPYLFNFHKRYVNSDSFCSGVNSGLRQLCQGMGLKKKDWYCVYTFRHTWGTVAQNDCKASISEVAFAMNHSHGHAITRGYIKIDFTPAWELNAKVIDFIFFSDGASKQECAKSQEPTKAIAFKVSPRKLITGSAYFQGKEMAKLTDVGFKNIGEVRDRLVSMLPDTIPDRAIVSFRLKNLDSGQEFVVDKIKGTDFKA